MFGGVLSGGSSTAMPAMGGVLSGGSSTAPMGALSSGGISPAMLQIMLMGMKAGAGMMGGKPAKDIMGGVAQDLSPLAMMDAQQKQALQGMQGGMDPKEMEKMRMLAMLKQQGLMGDTVGPGAPPPVPQGPPSPFIPPAGFRPGMMG